jgi:hypothetical protein
MTNTPFTAQSCTSVPHHFSNPSAAGARCNQPRSNGSCNDKVVDGFYRKVAVRYVFMAEELLRQAERRLDAVRDRIG